jgi:Protein of unknown function (DUF2490)
LKGVATNISQIGNINKKWKYNVHLLSVYNAKTLIVEGKIFPNGHCHFVPHILVNRKINQNLSLGGGGALGRHNIFGIKEIEPRYILQGMYGQKVRKLSIQHRLRYEYRIPKNLKTEVKDNASILRYQVGLNYPLYDPKQKQGLFLFASNESFGFLKGATNGPVSSKNGGFVSENWSNVGLGFTNSKHKIELGYGFQALVRNSAKDIRYLNMIQVNYQINLNCNDVLGWWYL